MAQELPKLTPADRDALIRRLYDEQDLAVDVLGGTRQLKELTATYGAETGLQVDEAMMLKRLTAMRKAGELPRNTDKPLHVKKPDAWPSTRRGERYLVDVTVPVGLDLIARSIAWSLNRGNSLPTSRVETLGMVRAYHAEDGQGTVGYRKESWERAQRLFPELIVPSTNMKAPPL